jgi:hypothetical protein
VSGGRRPVFPNALETPEISGIFASVRTPVNFANGAPGEPGPGDLKSVGVGPLTVIIEGMNEAARGGLLS